MTIERKNVNGNYEAKNCSWISKAEQAHNKRNNNNIEIDGEKHCITEWARLFKVSVTTLRKKNKSDWIQLYGEYYSSMKLEERGINNERI
nr:MAG TPA: helix-turn-helix domain protein [Caudoviricetes sp.]